ETHTLTIDQLPSHSHGPGSYQATLAGDHWHSTGLDLDFAAGGGGSALDFRRPAARPGRTGTAGAHTHSISGTSSNTGSGEAHNNVQPTIVLNYCIFAGA